MRIFAGIPWGGASNESGVVDNGNFQRLRIRLVLLYSDTQSVVSFSGIPKWMTLNDLVNARAPAAC